MIRSTEEWEISRSCHNAMSSKAACDVGPNHARQSADLFAGDRVAFVRHGGGALLAGARRALRLRAPRCAAGAGFRERSFRAWRRSGRARRRSWRAGRARSPGRRSARVPGPGGRRCALRLRVRYARRFRRRPKSCRRAFRRRLPRSDGHCAASSSYQRASFRPNVIGSAWMPCVRPIWTVCLNSKARRLEDLGQLIESAFDKLGSLADQQRLRGIDDIVRGQPIMQPARGFCVLRLRACSRQRRS